MVFMRRRPLMRAAVVGGGAYVAGRRAAQGSAGPAGQDQDYIEPDQQPAASSQPAPAGAAPSIPDQLSQLTTMRQQGTLTDSEFAAAKAKLLGT